MPEIVWETLAEGTDIRALQTVQGREGEGYLPIYRLMVDVGPAIGVVQAAEGVWRGLVESAVRQRLPYARVSISYEGSSVVILVDASGPQPTAGPLVVIGAIAAAIIFIFLGYAVGRYILAQARLPETAGEGLQKLVDNPWFPLAVFVLAVIALTR